MNPGQEEAGQTFLRMLAAGGLLGGATGLGMGVLRGSLPRYDPPKPAAPIFVDIPRAVDRPAAKPIPLPARTKEVPTRAEEKKDDKKTTKAAGWDKIRDGLMGILPTYTPPEGLPNAQTAPEVPLTGAAVVGGSALGALGGYHLTTKLHHAARRRAAEADLEAAQREYQDATLARATRLKAAADRAYAAFVKVATTPPSPSGYSDATRAFMSAMFPGLAANATWPGAGALNLAAATTMGGLGGYIGYNQVRDKEKSKAVSKAIRRVDEANVDAVPAPLIARVVPVAR